MRKFPKTQSFSFSWYFYCWFVGLDYAWGETHLRSVTWTKVSLKDAKMRATPKTSSPNSNSMSVPPQSLSLPPSYSTANKSGADKNRPSRIWGPREMFSSLRSTFFPFGAIFDYLICRLTRGTGIIGGLAVRGVAWRLYRWGFGSEVTEIRWMCVRRAWRWEETAVTMGKGRLPCYTSGKRSNRSACISTYMYSVVRISYLSKSSHWCNPLNFKLIAFLGLSKSGLSNQSNFSNNCLTK